MIFKRKVNQYDLDGNYIRSFDSTYAAEAEFKDNDRGIYHCLRGDIKSSHGYLWRFDDDLKAGEKTDPYKRLTPRGKAVIKYSTAGKFIARYDNIKEAAADIKTPDSYVNAWRRIKACCDRRERYAYGFVWQYEG